MSPAAGAAGPAGTPGEAPAPPISEPTLDQWLAVHGPLSAPAALAVVLKACATASTLDDRTLAACLASLTTAGIGRHPQEGWTWAPVAGPARAMSSEAEVVERLGAVLFECLTARPLAQRFDEEQALLGRLKALRPDLPPSIAELTARAVTRRGRDRPSLDQLASELRAAMGAAPRASGHGRRAAMAAGLVVLTAVAALAILGARWWREAPLTSHGLTVEETLLLDIKLESADYLALIGEHTAALQELQELERLWFRRVDLSDPRLVWARARQAWVRHLASDRLTAEQLLGPYLPVLDATLGATHPYTRTARLDLAGVVGARGAREAAAALRDEAARAMAAVVRTPALAWDEADGGPWPPHTIAHVTPHAPEREGFRRDTRRGGYLLPLTSTQRWLAALDGWRLHVRATAACRVSLVTGGDPRAIAFEARPADDRRWTARTEGLTPALVLSAPAGDAFAFTARATPGGRIEVRLADGSTHAARIDAGAVPPVPPYGLAFYGQPDASACAAVWWEIAAR